MLQNSRPLMDVRTSRHFPDSLRPLPLYTLHNEPHILNVQAQLGHARLSTTAEIYTHVMPASQGAAIEKLERAV
jgi:integrase